MRMMSRTRFASTLVVLALLLLVGVFFYGRYLGKSAAERGGPRLDVKAQVILDRITDQYFLVTKTVFVDSKAEIETPKNDNWTDLFVGKKITVRGMVRVDVGVDIKDLRAEHISVDSRDKVVTVRLPRAEILDSSLFGELDVEVDKAILDKIKGILKDTQNEDYNLALRTLTENANGQVTAQEDIFVQARTDSAKLVELIVKSLVPDYRVVVD